MATSAALITGASSGIGYELAKIFARNKQNVILVARSEKKLQEIARELEKSYGITATVIAKDVSKLSAVQEMYDAVQQAGIRVEYLVNNAGFGDFGFFTETSWEKELEMINLNMTSLTALTKLFAKDMVARKSGKIMNVASTASFQPGPLMAVYYATKSYVLSFSEAISNELKDKGVTVTALCPGPTESGFQSAAAMEDSKLVKGKKMPTSKDVAEYGYKAMMSGKVVAVHGAMNKLMAQSVRYTPRAVVRSLVRAMSERTH
ncbi:MAG: SDR family oxidoreductase [Candidatus Kapaibacterium sp.]|nr:MAG: SDR family oxidoreductase [Candidatus Kapabacteria bacterium]